MDIYNASKEDIWVGLYDQSNKKCDTPIGGSRKALGAGQTIAYDHGGKARVQIVFWNNAGGWGDKWKQLDVSAFCVAGPKTIFTDAAATLIQEDDDKFYICNHVVDSLHPVTVQDKIEHVVVLMMENRSLDNLMGWLYADKGNRPSRNIPQPSGTLPSFDGLASDSTNPHEDRRYWNTLLASQHDTGAKIYARKAGDGDWDPELALPSPGPVEVVPGFLESIFGTPTPAADAVPSMRGYLQNYRTHLDHAATGKSSSQLDTLAEDIMACYTPEQVPAFSALARSFAISDRWFCSAPCQTWPNRSFIHAGTAFGRLNNMEGLDDEGEHGNPFKNIPSSTPYLKKPLLYDVLDALGVRWKAYTDSFRSLFYQQFGKNASSLTDLLKDINRIDEHPNYIFVEPQMFFKWPYTQQDFHPPSKVKDGDETIRRVYEMLVQAGIWHKTMLIVTFDESGNCYDHVAPPRALRPPASDTPQFDAEEIGTLNPFDMYGPRIPTIVVSPYVDKGVVFRSGSAPVSGIKPEYDHCSVLATVRDWVFGARTLPTDSATRAVFIDNARVAAAPTVWPVLDSRRREMPSLDELTNDLASDVDPELYIEDLFPEE